VNKMEKKDIMKELIRLRWKRINLASIFLSERWKTLSQEEKDAVKTQADELDHKIEDLERQLKEV